MTFIRRRIDLIFALGHATLDAAGNNTVTVSGHRVSVSITDTVGPGVGDARIKVYGLTPSLLNELASLNNSTATLQANTIAVMAGDDVSGMALVFKGNIVLSQADYSQQPDTTLSIIANGAGLQAVQVIPPSSYPNGGDAAVMLQTLATQGTLGFLNYGASKILAPSYFTGSVKQQIDDICAWADFERSYTKGVLVIWPKGQSPGGPQCLISPENGMVGYPAYTTTQQGGGITVTTTFNPQLSVTNPVQVSSGLKVANGTWLIYSLAHDIESEVPGGQWFSHFVCQR